jgi:hypothetical protein
MLTETWEIYKNASEAESSDIVEDDLLSHVFKRRRTESKDELKSYLSEPTMHVKTNVLLWWKVILIKLHIILIIYKILIIIFVFI